MFGENEVVKLLKLVKKPEYATIVLVSMAPVVAAIIFLKDLPEQALPICYSIIILAAIINLMIVIRYIKSQETRCVASTDLVYGAFLREICLGVESAKNKKNRFLETQIGYKLNQYHDEAREWSTGTMKASSTYYNGVLLKMYQEASNVVATSVKNYNQTWNSPLGKLILKTHLKAKAEVTRIFIFKDKADVSSEDIQIMENHQNCKVNVLLYFEDSDAFDFGILDSKDFTFINNGDAIGVTKRYGAENLSATWYFSNMIMEKLYGQAVYLLIPSSVGLEDFLRQ